MRFREPLTLSLFSLAVAVGLSLELPRGEFPLAYAGTALLFAAAPFLGGFPVAAAGFLALKGFRYAVWNPHSGARHDLLPALLCLAFAALWAGARLRRREEAAPDCAYRDVFFLVTGALYFEAFAYKVASFSDWSSGALLCDLLRYHELFRGGAPAASCGPAAAPLAWATLAFEAAFLAGAWLRRARVPLLLTAIAFHVGIYVVLEVNFLLYQLGILVAMLAAELAAARSPEAKGFQIPG